MYELCPAPVTREPGVGKSSQLIHLLHFDRAYHKCPEAEKTLRLHHKAEVGIYLESVGWRHTKKKKEIKKNSPRGWLQLSCGFCEYLPSSSFRIVFSSCR